MSTEIKLSKPLKRALITVAEHGKPVTQVEIGIHRSHA